MRKFYKILFCLNFTICKSRTGNLCNYSSPKTTINKELDHTNPDGTFVSDWEYVKGLGDLDECNGMTTDGKYMYFVTDTYSYAGRCLKGEFKEDRPKGQPPRKWTKASK